MSIFQIFRAENAAIFSAKFADRARAALRIPQNRRWGQRSSSRGHALPLKLRCKPLRSNFRVCDINFSNFRHRKRGNFNKLAENLKIISARAAFCTSFNYIFAFCCRCLLLDTRANRFASDFLHLRHRFFKFSAPKTLQFSAQNSPNARVRRCASDKIAFLINAVVFM